MEDSDRQWLEADGGRRLGLLRTRAQLLRAIREHFDAQGFVEVDTPTIVPSPGLDVHLSAFEVCNPAGRSVGYLATSPEYQMKRLMSAGLERIYYLGKSYRADEEGAQHEREFTMLEWYRAGAGSDDLMQDTEALVATVAAELGAGLLGQLTPPWDRLTVKEAFERYAGASLSDVLPDQDRFFRLFVEQVEPALGKEKPVFLTDWPASMASLAKLKTPDTADRFEAFVQGVELCNGFSELTDPQEQRTRFEHDQTERRAQGKPIYPIDEKFLRALKDGLPACAGNALGVDRLLMLLTGTPEISDVIPFSRSRS